MNKLNKNIFYDNKATKGRGDITRVRLFKKFFFIVDESYNSNPLSLKSAIKNFNIIKITNSKKHLILGDMLELGKYSKKLHIEIGKYIVLLLIDFEFFKNLSEGKILILSFFHPNKLLKQVS